jgi:hypothetical protein
MRDVLSRNEPIRTRGFVGRNRTTADGWSSLGMRLVTGSSNDCGASRFDWQGLPEPQSPSAIHAVRKSSWSSWLKNCKRGPADGTKDDDQPRRRLPHEQQQKCHGHECKVAGTADPCGPNRVVERRDTAALGSISGCSQPDAIRGSEALAHKRPRQSFVIVRSAPAASLLCRSRFRLRRAAAWQ